ncbi:MAG: hypothetical protein A2Z72_00290 [Omnitrophica bacterium RBG_13_46_9]|nr:MAG: hypothetical protein A2Z72_00290 [Omnitrophica bacterium RBG_13_46_9]
MRRISLILSNVIICFFLCSIYKTYAQEEGSSDTQWKQGLQPDRQEVTDEREEIKQNAQAAGTEEAGSRRQIRDAAETGDMEKTAQITEQLRSIHEEHIRKMQEDKEGLPVALQELKKDEKNARLSSIDTNNDGVIDDQEKQRWIELERQRWLERGGQLDANKDGIIDQAEIEQARHSHERAEDIRDRQEDRSDLREAPLGSPGVGGKAQGYKETKGGAGGRK